MTTFDERNKAFESKFVHDEELRFQVLARRRKMLGLWAAEQMHKGEEESLEYALELVKFGVDANTEEVVKRVADDMQDAGLDVSEEQVVDKLDILNEKAFRQISKEQNL